MYLIFLTFCNKIAWWTGTCSTLLCNGSVVSDCILCLCFSTGFVLALCIFLWLERSQLLRVSSRTVRGALSLLHETQKSLFLLDRMRPLILIFRFVSFFKIHFYITLPSDGGVASSFPTVILNALVWFILRATCLAHATIELSTSTVLA
jgi:hypothetical protein